MAAVYARNPLNLSKQELQNVADSFESTKTFDLLRMKRPAGEQEEGYAQPIMHSQIMPRDSIFSTLDKKLNQGRFKSKFQILLEFLVTQLLVAFDFLRKL